VLEYALACVTVALGSVLSNEKTRKQQKKEILSKWRLIYQKENSLKNAQFGKALHHLCCR
jgi:hypothetical protein